MFIATPASVRLLARWLHIDKERPRLFSNI